eukprot:scaffold78365_cov63-Phaeocystis_antarctica.AAC.3
MQPSTTVIAQAHTPKRWASASSSQKCKAIRAPRLSPRRQVINRHGQYVANGWPCSVLDETTDAYAQTPEHLRPERNRVSGVGKRASEVVNGRIVERPGVAETARLGVVAPGPVSSEERRGPGHFVLRCGHFYAARVP